ncbi:MAG: lamin tail domain-containing protein, partial [Candidatus Cloacimonetes bacterium]|nr:lamin tail domain-containing protein [Candidatus Cloacimonadota bacterium]
MEIILGNFNNGLYKITVQIYFSGDTQTSNNIVSISFLIGESPIIISEIMYKPSLPNIEWFEIYNRSERDFSLLNWHFRDTDDDWNSIETNRNLPANTYAVISDDTLTIKNYYDDNILFFQTDDWPTSLSNVEDGILIADNYFTTLDSTLYLDNEISVPYNHSLERINPFEDVSDNWGVSIDSCGATPGRVNSITPKDYDLCAYALTKVIEENHITFITLSGFCSNIGFNDIEDAEAIFFRDSNFNSQYDGGEEISIDDFSIPYEGTEEFSYTFQVVEDNYYLFGFLIISNLDLDTSNNLIFTTYNSPQSYPLPINEIQYAPIDDEPEWLELYNNFSYPIDISNWILADNKDTLNLWSVSPICQPEEYIIIVVDESDTLEILQKYSLIDSTYSVKFAIGLPKLNNDEDMLLLRDEYGTL